MVLVAMALWHNLLDTFLDFPPAVARRSSGTGNKNIDTSNGTKTQVYINQDVRYKIQTTWVPS